jgi:hypothetical protein
VGKERIDRERLVRLLRMTESDQDAEALIAIRKSNDLLRAHKTSWARTIRRHCSNRAGRRAPSNSMP